MGGGARGLVAGMRAVLRSRSFSNKKSRPRSSSEGSLTPVDQTTTPPPNNNNNNNNSKSHRIPKSPFLGWRRTKSKDNSKAKTNTAPKDALMTERKGSCSQSQAKRLGSHSSDDYKQTSTTQRDNRTEERPTCVRQDVTQEPLGSSVETHSTSSERSEVKVECQVSGANMDERKSDFSNSCKYVNLPRSCVGASAHVNTGNTASDSQNCANTGTTNHISDGDENSVSSSSENVVLGSVKSCDSGRDNCRSEGCGEEARKTGTQETQSVVRDRGDGSDTQDVCHEGKLENDVCVGYSSDIHRNSKDNVYMNIRKGSTQVDREPWLKAALNYNLNIAEFPRNEVIVLALGIDQYIEEVFGYLDQSGTGKVSTQDFEVLCQVLGLTEEGSEERAGTVQKCQCVGSNLTLHGSLNGSMVSASKLTDVKCPLHLSLNDFHDKLCERFIRSAKAESLLPLAVRRPSNQRLVTSVVRIQRRYDVLENISRSLAEMSAKMDDDEAQPIDECPATGIVCSKCRQMSHVDRNSNISTKSFKAEIPYLQQQVLLLEQELHCLREVIEDMRIALQSSDAENLALQVRVKRGAKPRQGASPHELSLTDEEDTIDDLVRQLTELSRPALATETPETPAATPQTPVPGAEPQQTPVPRVGLPQIPVPGTGLPKISVPETSPPQTPVPGEGHLQTLVPRAGHPQAPTSMLQKPKRPSSPDDPLNTAFISGDLSVEAELQSTYEALQTAREEREAMQVDLQQTVGQLQEREADLRGAKLNLQAAHTALEKAHYDNHALVMEMAETRRILEESRSRLTEAWEDLRQAKETVLQKEKQLHEAQANLHQLRSSREQLVQGVMTARSLVAGSLEQVRAGEQALNTLAAHSSPQFSPNSITRLDSTCRADSGLYSEESERDDDTKSPDRSSGHISASEDDLWTPRHASDSVKDAFNSDPQRGDDSCSSTSFKSPSSTQSEFQGHIHGVMTPQLILIKEGDVPQWKSPSSGLPSTSTEIIEGLEKEVQWLQYTLSEAEKEWDEEQHHLTEDEVTVRQKAELLEEELRQVEAERSRLILIEDKLRQLLQVLLSLADMNLSRRTLSRLVLEALEDCSGIKLGDLSATCVAGDGDVSPLAFLNNLLSSTSNYQTLSTESLIHLALQGLTHTPGIPRFPERIEATLG